MKSLEKLIKEYRQYITYFICGVLTTVVNFVFFAGLTYWNVNIGISNTIAFIVSVLFAYLTNSKYVFTSSRPQNAKNRFVEITSFFGARISTFVIEMIFLYILMFLGVLPMVSKIFVAVITLVLNYLFSKLLVFK